MSEMKGMKRGQAAMEFLMTYGWAILVVLVAIGALAYFGVLSPDKFLPEKCVLSSGSGLFCSNFNVDRANNRVTLLVKNSLSDSISLAATSALRNSGVALNRCTATAVVIASDGESSVVFDNCAITAGEKLKLDIELDYTVGAIAFSKSTTGSLIAKAP